jgi:hypothetical protein
LDESLELIDFDELRQTLGELASVASSYEEKSDELTRLRNDYRQRIIGMLKANLACRQNEEETELAARLSEESDIKAAELIRLYHQTAARFRDNFPNNFRYLAQGGRQRRTGDKWKEFKI